MTDVKEILPELLGRLFGRLRSEVAGLLGSGLRFSHVRVLDAVPAEGASVTSLADRLGMTKQGCGQFVTQLTAAGLVTREAEPGDRRVRRVRLTPEGARLLGRAREAMAQAEQDFAAEVGPRRYATFRRVLEELGQDARA
ncbi:MarR family transcriptional regulator [Arthrobacter sp. NEB 688]|uniref:MarR family winged helix-turn-helix transcriptional regulator n=1 Tax=Arthrobacter sp. NEB 688 TaxID=904039 RepID=UPI0015637CF5|nr:MarR family transcriptional regulator [Arthrobacter sp. NEB 688]QKE84192.1 MarR family transcriptional regulator [Arthrobacter sp. NEB 688]